MFSISRGIVCHHYFKVMMTSVIAGFQIQMVPSRWYIDDQKDKDVVAKTYFVNQEAERNFSDATLVPNSSTIPPSITTVLRCAAKKKAKYGEVWGLARQATQLAIEHESHDEIIGWLKQFINRQKEIITELEDNKENELEQIKNPLVSRRKGCPETKRYKSSTEKKPRAKYTCGTCSQPGHNSARYRNQ